MLQILIHEQFKGSYILEFLCTGWKPTSLEKKLKDGIVGNLHIFVIRNKEESQRQKRREDIDRYQKLADSIWNYVHEE
jgi:hypothetical protein